MVPFANLIKERHRSLVMHASSGYVDDCDTNVKSGFIVTIILQWNLNKAAWPLMGVWQKEREEDRSYWETDRKWWGVGDGGTKHVNHNPITPLNMTHSQQRGQTAR